MAGAAGRPAQVLTGPADRTVIETISVTIHVADPGPQGLPATGTEVIGLIVLALALVAIGAAFLVVGDVITRRTP